MMKLAELIEEASHYGQVRIDAAEGGPAGRYHVRVAGSDNFDVACLGATSLERALSEVIEALPNTMPRRREET